MNLDLPQGWESTTLDSLISFVIGGDWGISPNFVDKDYADVLCIRGSEFRNWDTDKGSTASLRKVKNSSVQKRVLQEGDILVEISGGGPDQPVGRVVLIDKSVLAYNPNIPKICTNFLRLVRPAPDIDSDFLTTYLTFFYKSGEIVDYQAGSNNLRNLKFNDYVRIDVPLPPFNEQQRIVAKIEELFAELEAGVASLQTARVQLQTYRQALLKHAFEGKLTEQWRTANADKVEPATTLLQRIRAERQARYEAELAAWQAEVKAWEANGKRGKKPNKPRPLKELPPLIPQELTDLPELPAGWAWVKLSLIAENIQIGPFGSLLHREDYIANGTPLINPSHIKDLKIVPDLSLTVDEAKLNELGNYKLQTNDIIMGRRGEMGRCAVVGNIENGWLCGTGSLFIRLLPSMNPDFYCLILSSQRVKQFLSSESIGTTMQNLNQKILHDVPVPICSELEQKEIFYQLEAQQSVVDQLEQTITAALQQAEALRQAILKKAFAGQLVPQDPNDEPASALLARIQAAKS